MGNVGMSCLGVLVVTGASLALIAPFNKRVAGWLIAFSVFAALVANLL